MILIISTCEEKLSELEFVKPIEDIVEKDVEKDFTTKHYSQLTKSDAIKADKLIICGNALKDTQYLGGIEKFSFLKDFEKPVLGICAGMQIIAKIYGSEFVEKTEIGIEYINISDKDVLFDNERASVYQFHKRVVKPSSDFKILAKSDTGTVHAIKHKTKTFYGVLFHPESRHKEIIENFLKI